LCMMENKEYDVKKREPTAGWIVVVT